MLLVIDNFDSFTYNLVQIFARYDRVEVRRNNQINAADVRAMAPRAVVISPGPGRPEDSGCTLEVIRECSGALPLFGVCLGLQALAQAHGAKVVRAEKLMHGKTSRVYHDGRGLFRGVANPMTAMRYHSLVVAPDSLPPELEVSAHTSDGEIMALRHRSALACAVQFHPESILTAQGEMIIDNFMALLGRPAEVAA